ncbi:hypothetical protein LEMLEM_LOCUS21776 [Lemmus lemmus]
MDFCAHSCCRSRRRAAQFGSLINHQARLGRSRQLLQGLRRVLGIFHRWADPQSCVPLVERGGVAAWVRRHFVTVRGSRLPRQNANSHVRTPTPTSERQLSRQNANSHVRTPTLTSERRLSRQNANSHVRKPTHTPFPSWLEKRCECSSKLLSRKEESVGSAHLFTPSPVTSKASGHMTIPGHGDDKMTRSETTGMGEKIPRVQDQQTRPGPVTSW